MDQMDQMEKRDDALFDALERKKKKKKRKIIRTVIIGDPVQVTVGITNSNYAEITSGLKEGDTVWYKKTQTNPFAKQLARVEGFGQVIVSTGVQTLDAVFEFGARRQHQDGRAAALGPNFAGKRVSVEARHHNVEDPYLTKMGSFLPALLPLSEL